MLSIASRPKIMTARGTSGIDIRVEADIFLPELVPGSRPLMASVTTRVVMSILSAAGSSMVPSTVRMLYLRATYPSNYATENQWVNPI